MSDKARQISMATIGSDLRFRFAVQSLTHYPFISCVPFFLPFPFFHLHLIDMPNAELRFQNDPSLPWVVQKFGGTSVGKFLENIADQVIK